MDTENLDKNIIKSLSSKIAEKANECCYRSDGWEQEIQEYVEDLLINAFGNLDDKRG